MKYMCKTAFLGESPKSNQSEGGKHSFWVLIGKNLRPLPTNTVLYRVRLVKQEMEAEGFRAVQFIVQSLYYFRIRVRSTGGRSLTLRL